jgi:hypothetical protein
MCAEKGGEKKESFSLLIGTFATVSWAGPGLVRFSSLPRLLCIARPYVSSSEGVAASGPVYKNWYQLRGFFFFYNSSVFYLSL